MSDISVTIGGDFCPEGRPQAALLDGSLSPDAIVGFVRPLFTGSDIGMVNLECPLSGRGSPILKAGRAIRARPETVGILKHLG
ncbi:MAG: CapA family protein, partial [Deltaproteobacteria bacterium]|nr:CapA family protein [Deltaproteobacteria bacterium]